MNMRQSFSAIHYRLHRAERTAIAGHPARAASADNAASTISADSPICVKSRQGFGLNEVIGIAAGIIIAVVVVIPGLRGFAASVLDQLTDWWNSMAAGIFAG